jgi:hypothetical protein
VRLFRFPVGTHRVLHRRTPPTAQPRQLVLVREEDLAAIRSAHIERAQRREAARRAHESASDLTRW